MSALVDILLKGLNLSPGEKATLARELAKLEDTALDVGKTVLSGGRVKRITNSNLTIEDGLTIVNPETGYITVHLQPDGDAFFGDNVEIPGSTSFIIFSQAQTYNGEAMGAGDVLLGDNSTGQANILWDASEGKFLLRGGTTDNIAIDTDGALTFYGAAQYGPTYLQFRDSANSVMQIGMYVSGGAAQQADINVPTVPLYINASSLFVTPSASGWMLVDGDVKITEGLIVGVASNPVDGAIKLQEISEPDAPAANQGILYLKDVGGKTALYIRFASGASQQIAIEP